MAKIAAIILPTAQVGRLDELAGRMSHALCLVAHHRSEAQSYFGQDMSSTLTRIGPDPIDRQPQPVSSSTHNTVACGYYLRDDNNAHDSATRLHDDLAQKGMDALPSADGVYAFAQWDNRRECLIVGVDKLGMRPLYWASLPGGSYAVASEIKALAAIGDLQDTNWSAWEKHLSVGFIFGNHTFFNRIERVGPAEVITFGRRGVKSRTVENFLETITGLNRPLDDFLEEQGAVFDLAMKRLASLYDAPRDTMLTLSAGIDSRRALAWLLKNDIRPTAYTIPDVQANGREYESAIVRGLCRATELEGYVVHPARFADRMKIRELRDLATDFESDEHLFSMTLAAGLTCHDKVNFDGLGAGTQLSGSFVIPEHFQPGGKARFLAGLPAPARLWLNLPDTGARPLEETVRAEMDRWGDDPNRFAYFYMMSRTRREIALAPHSIQANVFESLSPFLDREMMRSALSFPPERKVGVDTQSHLIEALDPGLGRVPTIQTPGVTEGRRFYANWGANHWNSNLKSLRKAAGLRSRPATWSVGFKQRLKFRVAGLKVTLGPDSRLRWEFGKAAKLGQLAHFDRVTESANHYRSAISRLEDAIAGHATWCRPL